ALPPTTEAHSLAVLAARVRALARDHDRIAIKLPSAAGGEGNAVIDAACVRDLPLAAVRETLRGLLVRLGWPRPFPLLVSVWESPVCATPSVQLWVPHAGAGTPIVEGIFEQQVCGPTGVFAAPCPPTSRRTSRSASRARPSCSHRCSSGSATSAVAASTRSCSARTRPRRRSTGSNATGAGAAPRSR